MKVTWLKPLAINSTFLISILASGLVTAANIYETAINHPLRLQTDMKFDKTRNPSAILPFTKIKSGDTVLELGAGGGYTTELLAWTVGAEGKVYAHFLYNQDRLNDNRLANTVSLRQHALAEHHQVLKENQIAENSLDAVVIFFIFHDIYLNKEMDDALLPTLYKALKPGGKLIILDNSAKVGTELKYIGDLHRIDEEFVKSVLMDAGFELDEETNVLRNAKDDRTQPWGEFKGGQDRFAFRFTKPR